MKTALLGVIEQVQNVQTEKNDYCLQQVLDKLDRFTEELPIIDELLVESEEKYISLPDLPDVAFKNLL